MNINTIQNSNIDMKNSHVNGSVNINQNTFFKETEDVMIFNKIKQR